MIKKATLYHHTICFLRFFSVHVKHVLFFQLYMEIGKRSLHALMSSVTSRHTHPTFCLVTSTTCIRAHRMMMSCATSAVLG